MHKKRKLYQVSGGGLNVSSIRRLTSLVAMSALLVSSISFADGNNSRIFRSIGQIEYGNSVLIDAQDFDRAKGYTDAVNQTTQSAVVQLGSNIDAQMTTLDRRVSEAEGKVDGVDNLLYNMEKSVNQLKVDVAANSPNGAGGDDSVVAISIINNNTTNGQRTTFVYTRGGTRQATSYTSGSMVMLADPGSICEVYSDYTNTDVNKKDTLWKCDSSFPKSENQDELTADEWRVFDTGYVQFTIPDSPGGFTISYSAASNPAKTDSTNGRIFTTAWGSMAGVTIERGQKVSKGVFAYVTFDPNDGVYNGTEFSTKPGLNSDCPYTQSATGSMPIQSFAVKGSENNLTKNRFARVNYKFVGWSTNKNATVQDVKNKVEGTYTDQESVKITSDTTLYAIWEIQTITIQFLSGMYQTNSSGYYYAKTGGLPIALQYDSTNTGTGDSFVAANGETIYTKCTGLVTNGTATIQAIAGRPIYIISNGKTVWNVKTTSKIISSSIYSEGSGITYPNTGSSTTYHGNKNTIYTDTQYVGFIAMKSGNIVATRPYKCEHSAYWGPEYYSDYDQSYHSDYNASQGYIYEGAGIAVSTTAADDAPLTAGTDTLPTAAK